MKFTCEKYLLQSAVGIASRCTASKSPTPELEGLLIEAGVDVRVTGYDLKKGVYTSFPADIEDTGSVVLNARLLGDIVRNLPGDFVTIHAKDGFLTKIKGFSADYDVMGMDPENYPAMPDFEHTISLVLPRRTLSSMLRGTIFSVSDNDSRPVFTGALFDVSEEKLTVVAVDGFRLALRRETVARESDDCYSFIVPGSVLSEAEKLCGDSEDEVVISMDERHVSFRVGSSVLISRRLEGEFLNYRKSVPTEFTKLITVETAQLAGAVSRTSIVADVKAKTPLRCTFRDGRIDLLCSTALGRAVDNCPCEGNGEDIEVGFNPTFLEQALKACPDEKVTLCLNTGSTPAVIRPTDSGDNYLYMILPVRLRVGA